MVVVKLGDVSLRLGEVVWAAQPLMGLSEFEQWRKERWGAVVLLCGLADDHPDVLRRAAGEVADDEVADEWADQRANALLLDAAALAAIETDDESGG